MTRKYNGRHSERGRSGYKGRLAKRGLSKAPALTPVEYLRGLQERRKKATGSPFPTAASAAAETQEAEAA